MRKLDTVRWMSEIAVGQEDGSRIWVKESSDCYSDYPGFDGKWPSEWFPKKADAQAAIENEMLFDGRGRRLRKTCLGELAYWEQEVENRSINGW